MERISFKDIAYSSNTTDAVKNAEVSGETAEKIDLFNF